MHLKDGSINAGDITQVWVSMVDLAKIDCKDLTLMVVEEKTFKKRPPICCLANKLFQLKSLHGLRLITYVKNTDPKVVNLDRVLASYQGLL